MEILSFLSQLSDHSWYTFNTQMDQIRSFIWITIQLLTAIAYFSIPLEYFHWRKAFPYSFFDNVLILFMGFTLFCGLHHIIDVIIMPTAPWWAIWSVNFPMMVFSVATAVFLRMNRERIIEDIRIFVEALRNLGIIKE